MMEIAKSWISCDQQGPCPSAPYSESIVYGYPLCRMLVNGKSWVKVAIPLLQRSKMSEIYLFMLPMLQLWFRKRRSLESGETTQCLRRYSVLLDSNGFSRKGKSSPNLIGWLLVIQFETRAQINARVLSMAYRIRFRTDISETISEFLERSPRIGI